MQIFFDLWKGLPSVHGLYHNLKDDGGRVLLCSNIEAFLPPNGLPA